MTYILDTNIIIAIMKGNQNVVGKFREAISRGDGILINCISYYEIKRGYLAINAVEQLKKFEAFCKDFGICFVDDQSILDYAAEIYANLKIRGELIGDADILIAAIAKQHDAVVVSDNVGHFQRIQGLGLENWLNR